MIQARNITLSTNGRNLLSSVNLEVHPGKFTAIAGPNGAGKTSLLKVMSGEQTKHSGDVTINGMHAGKYSASDLSLLRSVLPQNTQVQFAFSVRQIVE